MSAAEHSHTVLAAGTLKCLRWHRHDLNDFYQEAIDRYGRDGDISEEMETRVKRKIDLIVLPWSVHPTGFHRWLMMVQSGYLLCLLLHRSVDYKGFLIRRQKRSRRVLTAYRQDHPLLRRNLWHQRSPNWPRPARNTVLVALRSLLLCEQDTPNPRAAFHRLDCAGLACLVHSKQLYSAEDATGVLPRCVSYI